MQTNKQSKGAKAQKLNLNPTPEPETEISLGSIFRRIHDLSERVDMIEGNHHGERSKPEAAAYDQEAHLTRGLAGVAQSLGLRGGAAELKAIVCQAFLDMYEQSEGNIYLPLMLDQVEPG